jgi:hypothetical protein
VLFPRTKPNSIGPPAAEKSGEAPPGKPPAGEHAEAGGLQRLALLAREHVFRRRAHLRDEHHPVLTDGDARRLPERTPEDALRVLRVVDAPDRTLSGRIVDGAVRKWADQSAPNVVGEGAAGTSWVTARKALPPSLCCAPVAVPPGSGVLPVTSKLEVTTVHSASGKSPSEKRTGGAASAVTVRASVSPSANARRRMNPP